MTDLFKTYSLKMEFEGLSWSNILSGSRPCLRYVLFIVYLVEIVVPSETRSLTTAHVSPSLHFRGLLEIQNRRNWRKSGGFRADAFSCC